jgi:small subunit ribosomal protein S17
LSQEASSHVPRKPARPAPVKRVGVVDSISGAKTVRVAFRTLVRDRMYGKYLRRRTRLMVHDEQQQAAVGDTVEVARCRPHSKRKSWRLVRVVKRAGEGASAPAEPAGEPSAGGGGEA